MGVKSSVVLLIFGMVFLCIVAQETEAAGGFEIMIPMDFQLKQLSGGKKCLALMWRGMCKNDTCVTKFKRTLSKKSLLSIASQSTETQTFQPFKLPNTSYYDQAICYYDSTSEAGGNCCDQISSGLKATGQSTAFVDWDWIKFKLTRYHVNNTGGSHLSKETKSFVLPWNDYCVLYKPCANGGSCNNEDKPRNFNCTCMSGWKGDNCTVEAPSSIPITTTSGSQGTYTAVFAIILLTCLSWFFTD